MFIIGGGEVYKQVLQEGLVDEMIISWMDFEAEGEVSFPRFDKSEWEVKSREKREQFEIVHYVRTRVPEYLRT
jgi:dihydrofolate reductase